MFDSLLTLIATRRLTAGGGGRTRASLSACRHLLLSEKPRHKIGVSTISLERRTSGRVFNLYLKIPNFLFQAKVRCLVTTLGYMMSCDINGLPRSTVSGVESLRVQVVEMGIL